MKPVISILRPDDYVTTQWSGGSTTQLTIAPANAVYAERDFLWRVSSATVELEESDFTPLPDYRRFISTVRGDMALSHNGGAELTLHPGDIHDFDGGDDTHSRGRCTDFNLMLRKGKADGLMGALRLSSGETPFEPEPKAETVLLYCAAGHCAVRCGAEESPLSTGESLLLRGAAPLTLKCADPALVMTAQMWTL
ncbi:MAG: HutD family protein [Oscillospiraceae bacterium]|nr:HutD family protein [Oscillospiraceae bacterium]